MNLYKLTVLFLITGAPAFANHEELVHFAAHAGVSYAMTSIFYGAGKRTLGVKYKVFNIIAASVLTLAAGAAYDSLQPNKGSSFPRNLAGVAISAGSIILFDF